jgi:arylsulfatase A-like enzyme
LVRDFAYAEQVNFVHPRDEAFSKGYERIAQKNLETLVQKQPGSISFTLRLFQDPVLKYSVLFDARKFSDLDLFVTVESDYPKKNVRNFKPALNRVNRVDLTGFQNRVIKISFSASSRNLRRLGGVVHWVDPVVEGNRPVMNQDQDRLQAFREREKQSNLMIFLFDAANASHVGAYGYSRRTTPVIDSIAATGVLWKNAFSQAVSTLASTGTLFTGVLPDVHHVLHKPTALHERFKTMAECFRDNGFETAIFTANPNASGMAGYDQGFNYVWEEHSGGPVSAREMVPFVNTWLDRVRNRQFFAYIHFREPHEPYDPPPEALAKFTSAPDFKLPYFEAFRPPDEADGIQKVITAYDANLSFGDEEFGRIIQRLKENGLFEKTIILIIADHGEAFWAHGKQGHNSQVYDDMIHIPMIMRFPRSADLQGVKPERLVGTIDLFPTFADLFQFSRKGVHLSGESLLPILVHRDNDPDRMIVSQTSSQDAYSLRSSEFKYICYPSQKNPPEFYHLTLDPGEKDNAIADYPVLSSYYRETLLKVIEHSKSLKALVNSGPERTAVIDTETEEELRALGYVN